MSEAPGLYLGRLAEPATGAAGPTPLRLDPVDLTTHAVVIGMTGSGKTGLCIDLLEEAALAGIPALAIDPKGDLGNLLLTFPELRPEDFAPWVPPGEAERKGESPETYALAVAETWRKGLAEWGLDGGRIRALRNRVELTLFTPGSRAGVSVDVLSSFAPPKLSWNTEEEALRESIRVSVTALLALLGVEADPIQSREHIFLSHLVETAWRSGAPCDVVSLIRGLQTPPFTQLGVFEVESFFPTRERMKLALALNALLAAPGFHAWMEGEALDPATLLRTPEGKPRVSIFYLGHLAEREKLFFTTLLLSAANVWMRRQGGTTAMRALVYVDEVLGMIPPYPANPPTKEILLLLMKQARAFGLGMVLTTQNPVDVDYKVLTNAGTWFVGRLQTQQDKDRVLEGLVGQGGVAGSGRAELDARIGSLPRRGFLMNSARGGGPVTFRSRWAMSYLRGPLTKEEIERLTPKTASPAIPSAAGPAPAGVAGPQPKPPELAGGSSLFLTPEGLKGLGPMEPAPDFVSSGTTFAPALYATATIRYDEARAGLNLTERAERLIFPLPPALVSWNGGRPIALGADGVAREPHAPAAFEPLPAGLSGKGVLASLRKSFVEHLLANATRDLYAVPDLRLYSRHDEDRPAFEARLARERAALRDAEVAKLRDKYEGKLTALQRKLEREEADVASAQATHEGRKREELVSGAESVFSFILGRKRSAAVSQATRQRRMTETARLKADRERGEAASVRAALEALNAELETDMREIDARRAGATPEIQTLSVRLERDDVNVETVAVLWIPVARSASSGASRTFRAGSAELPLLHSAPNDPQDAATPGQLEQPTRRREPGEAAIRCIRIGDRY